MVDHHNDINRINGNALNYIYGGGARFTCQFFLIVVNNILCNLFAEGMNKRPAGGDGQHLLGKRGGTSSLRTTNGHATTIHMNGRPTSPNKQLFTKTNKHRSFSRSEKINVNERPFSASKAQTSPYAQRLVGTAPPPRRVKSGRALKTTM